LQKLEPRQWFFVCVAGGALLKNMHVYRSLRAITMPVFGGLVAYRMYAGEAGGTRNFAEQLLDFIKMDNARVDKILGDVLGIVMFVFLLNLILKIIDVDFMHLKKDLMDYGYSLVRNTSFVKNMVKHEQDKIEIEFEGELKAKSRAVEKGHVNTTLPKVGIAGAKLLKLMKDSTAKENVAWESGKVSGAVYHGIETHRTLLNKAFAQYSISNPLHSDIWPSVMKFESEIVSMTAALVSGDKKDTVCGSTTSGGTESIILAIKSHRDFYRDNHGITEPHMVVGESAHAAVDKACDLMNIKLTKVSLMPGSFKVDVAAMERAIGPNTIMLYASAPSFPHGAIDPIRDIGQLAVKYGIGLHVDCCLGGFVLPFAKKLCYKIPDFDFSVPGVSTMSLDTHK
jgi:sphinganine-1-phosphate aldolase